MQTIPKSWKKTPEEQEKIWRNIRLASIRLEQSTNPPNLYSVNVSLAEIKILVKQLERAQVADALDKVKK